MIVLAAKPAKISNWRAKGHFSPADSAAESLIADGFGASLVISVSVSHDRNRWGVNGGASCVGSQSAQHAVYRTLGLGIVLAFGPIGLFIAPVVLAGTYTSLVVWVADDAVDGVLAGGREGVQGPGVAVSRPSRKRGLPRGDGPGRAQAGRPPPRRTLLRCVTPGRDNSHVAPREPSSESNGRTTHNEDRFVLLIDSPRCLIGVENQSS